MAKNKKKLNLDVVEDGCCEILGDEDLDQIVGGARARVRRARPQAAYSPCFPAIVCIFCTTLGGGGGSGGGCDNVA